MNNFFNWNRFLLLYKKNYSENKLLYLTSYLVLLGLLTGFYLLNLALEGFMPSSGRILTMNVFLVFAGLLFCSSLFMHFNQGRKNFVTQTLPVSSFEHFVAAWLNAIIFYPAIFLLSFYIIDTLFVFQLFKFKHTNQIPTVLNFFDAQSKPFAGLLFYWGISGFYLLGSVYFKKQAFINTTLVFIGLGALSNLIVSYLVHHAFGPDSTPGSIFINSWINIKAQHNYSSINVSHETEMLISTGVVLIALIVWFATYFKIKEKQI